MLIAENSKEERITATKEQQGFCPQCGKPLIAKMGDIKIHHWAHKGEECDSWKGNESIWHYDWKVFFGIDNCEKTVNDEHRADVLIDDLVIEVQKSHMSEHVCLERESYYKKHVGNICWIAHYDTFQNLNIFHPPRNRRMGSFVEVTMKRPKAWYSCANEKIFFDIGGGGVLETFWPYVDYVDKTYQDRYGKYRDSQSVRFKCYGIVHNKSDIKDVVLNRAAIDPRADESKEKLNKEFLKTIKEQTKKRIDKKKKNREWLEKVRNGEDPNEK